MSLGEDLKVFLKLHIHESKVIISNTYIHLPIYKGRIRGNCSQLINMDEMINLENPHLATILVTNESGKNYK